MKSVETHGTFDEAIADAGDDVQAIARRLRELIVDVYPDVVEVPWPNQGIVGYGVGPKKMSEHFCYVGVYKHHANLGFYYGASLEDPEGLLAGAGKKLRHVRVEEVATAERPAVRELVVRALAEREEALGG